MNYEAGKSIELKYSAVVVFCPSDPLVTSSKISYFEMDVDRKSGEKIYLGGEVRMRAAVAATQMTERVVVVGGSKIKVDGMRDYLIQEMGEKEIENHPEIIRVESAPDTLGNLRAVSKMRVNLGRRIGLLSNSYHFPRILTMAEEVMPTKKFHVIAAEGIVGWDALSYPDEFMLRLRRETEGFLDWQSGIYVNQANLDRSSWKSVVYDRQRG